MQGLIFLNIESYGGGVKLWSGGEDEEEGGGGGEGESLGLAVLGLGGTPRREMYEERREESC